MKILVLCCLAALAFAGEPAQVGATEAEIGAPGDIEEVKKAWGCDKKQCKAYCSSHKMRGMCRRDTCVCYNKFLFGQFLERQEEFLLAADKQPIDKPEISAARYPDEVPRAACDKKQCKEYCRQRKLKGTCRKATCVCFHQFLFAEPLQLQEKFLLTNNHPVEKEIGTSRDPEEVQLGACDKKLCKKHCATRKMKGSCRKDTCFCAVKFLFGGAL